MQYECRCELNSEAGDARINDSPSVNMRRFLKPTFPAIFATMYLFVDTNPHHAENIESHGLYTVIRMSAMPADIFLYLDGPLERIAIQYIQAFSSIPAFRQRLKTFLFRQYFPDLVL